MKLASNSMMRAITAGALSALALSSAVMAASDGPAGREPRAAAVADSPTTRQRVAAALAAPAASEKELEDIADFMRQYAPARWAALESLPESGAARPGVMVYVIARWRHLQMVHEEDPELYDIKVQQMSAEDSIYGLLARTRSPADREPLRKTLRDKVARLVELGLKEREHRIERLRQTLKTEEDKLAQDRGRMNSMVDHRVDAFITDGPVTLHPDLPSRPRRGPIAPGAEEGPPAAPPRR